MISARTEICASCGGRAGRPVAHHGRWTYLECAGCRSLELSPVPTQEELREYYNSAYSVQTDGYFRAYERMSRVLLRSIEQEIPRGTLLEVGCSHGAFLLEARQSGWDVIGVEISEHAAGNARKRGLAVHTGTVEQNDSSLGVFDCIVSWYVIEHIVDVNAFLDVVRKHLRRGGLLVLRTANARALVARAIPQYWQWIDAPAHIRLFSPAGMQQLLERHGFSTIQQSTRRGNARTFATDVLMAGVKAVVDGKGRVAAASVSAHNGCRARKLSRYTDFVFKPLDWILGVNGHSMLGAELFVMANSASR